MAERYENEDFYAQPGAPSGPAAVSEALFYAGRERPPRERSFALRAAATPLRFGIVLFLVGWAGIIFQRSFLQQVVFGAPVFEELAKFGPPLVLATILGARTLALRMPLAWASGASFGVLEHFLTYAEEDVWTFAGRITFHAAATGLSMLVYGAFEDASDSRARWASTVPATLFHWANNFGAVAFGIASIRFHEADAVAQGWSVLVTGGIIGLTLVALARRTSFEERAQLALAQAMPRLGLSSES